MTAEAGETNFQKVDKRLCLLRNKETGTDHNGLGLVELVDRALPVRELVKDGSELAVSKGAEVRREVGIRRRLELEGWLEMTGRLRDWLWVTESVGRRRCYWQWRESVLRRCLVA